MLCPAQDCGPPSLADSGTTLFSCASVAVPFAGGVVIFTTTCCATQSLLYALCCATCVFTPDGAVDDSDAAMVGARAASTRTEHRANVRMFSPQLNRRHPDARLIVPHRAPARNMARAA